ncbi:MAG: hypothetical protein RIQ90_783 [Bacteroidota bacterium]|jgi:hypothetical protein
MQKCTNFNPAAAGFFMRIIFCFGMVFCSLTFGAQSLLHRWEGTYVGTLEVYSQDPSPRAQVPVRLCIKNLKKDSVWQYLMAYGKPDEPGYMEKNYQIIFANKRYVLDEGDGILIPMTHFGNCLFDFYTLGHNDEKTYMQSNLCEVDPGSLSFNLAGGPLTPMTKKEITEENSEPMTLDTYPLTFYQSVVLKKQP